MAESNTLPKYNELSLPYLYKLCIERGIKGYWMKNEDEAINLLKEYDTNHPIQKPSKSVQESEMAKATKNDAVESNDEELNIDDLNLEDEDITEKVEKKLAGEDKDEPAGDDLDLNLEDDKPAKEDADGLTDKDIDAAAAEVGDDINLEDDITEDKPSQKKEKVVAKKDVSSEKVEKKAAAPEKKAEKAAPAEKKEPSGPRGRRVDPNADNPFAEKTAGWVVFKVLQKATKPISLDKIIEVVNANITKLQIAPPKDTKAKARIIIQEINAGKRGDKWGSFKSEDGKVQYIPK